MRITKRQLRRIIKEERANLASGTSQVDISRQLGELHNAIDKLITVMGPDEVANELEGIAEEIRMGMV